MSEAPTIEDEEVVETLDTSEPENVEESTNVPDVDDEDEQSSGDDGEEFDVEEEPDVAEADVSEDDFDASDLFSGTETADTGSDEEPDNGGGGEPASSGGGSMPSGAISGSVNEGLARLAVVDWPDDADSTADEMEKEFAEVFEAFRVGDFAERSMEEYLMADADEIDPFWGLCGSLVLAAAFTTIMRPDGEERVANLADSIGVTGF